MKRLFVLSIIISILAFVPMANALTIPFNTMSATLDGLPVSASATFVTALNSIDITLTNLQADPKSVIQCLSDLSFTMVPAWTGGSPSLISSSGLERTIAGGGGAFTEGSVVSTGWVLRIIDSDTLKLDGLGAGTMGPKHTIIGPPNGSTPPMYASANSSIAGNGPHNPFLAGPVTFALSVPGVTADTTITDVVFSFGTASGRDVPGTPPIPEPATMLLLGSGLVGLGGVTRRKFFKK